MSAGVQTVLVVEDNVDSREALMTLLRMSGYDPVGAADGAEALRLLREGYRPRVVLLDLWMPGMNGWEFREAQLRTPEFAAIPTIVLTADVGGAVPGIAHHLHKPVDVGAMMALLSQYC
jgi:two-component system chemotaxis response regulator CheY